MRPMLTRFWNDDRGTVLSAELMMLVTLLAIGLIVGAKSFRDAAVTEWADWAQAIANLDQSYNVPDSAPAAGDGSGYSDFRDFCDDVGATGAPRTTNYQVAPMGEQP